MANGVGCQPPGCSNRLGGRESLTSLPKQARALSSDDLARMLPPPPPRQTSSISTHKHKPPQLVSIPLNTLSHWRALSLQCKRMRVFLTPAGHSHHRQVYHNSSTSLIQLTKINIISFSPTLPLTLPSASLHVSSFFVFLPFIFSSSDQPQVPSHLFFLHFLHSDSASFFPFPASGPQLPPACRVAVVDQTRSPAGGDIPFISLLFQMALLCISWQPVQSELFGGGAATEKDMIFSALNLPLLLRNSKLEALPSVFK